MGTHGGDPIFLLNPSLKRHIKQAVAIVLIFSGMAWAETVSKPSLQKGMDEGRQFMRAGKWQDAVDFFESLSKTFPDEAEIQLRLGISYLRLGRLDPAEAALREAIRLDPGGIEARLRLAGLLEARQKLSEALEVYEAVLKLGPPGEMMSVSRFKIKMIQGILQARSRNFDQALGLFKAAEKITPDDPGVHYNIGLIYLQKKDDPAAEKAFQQVVAINPDHQDAHVRLGDLYARQGDIEQALARFEKVLAINTEGPGAQIAKSKMPVLQGRLLARHGRFEEALSVFLNALSFSGEQAELHYHIGRIYMIQKRPKEAEQAFLKVLSADAGHQETYLNLGNLYESQGRLAEALAAFTRAVDINAENPGGVSANQKIPLLRGSLLAQQGRLKEALSVFEGALKTSRAQAALYFNMGRIHLQLGDTRKAEALFLKTVQENPRHQRAYIHLGSLYEQREALEKAVAFYEKAAGVNSKNAEGESARVSTFSVRGKIAMRTRQFESALKWFQTAIEVQPDNPANFFNLGVFYQQIKDFDAAVVAFEKVMTLDPKDKNAYLILSEIQISKVLALIREVRTESDFLSALPGLAAGGQVFRFEEKLGLARHLLQRLSRLAPEDSKMMLQVIAEQIEVGRAEEAGVQDYAALLPLTFGKVRRFAQVRFHLLNGVVSGREGNLSAARAEFEALLVLDPEEPMGYFNLGFIALRRKNAGEALRHFNQAVALAPKDRAKRLRLASLYEEVGQSENALKHYNIALEDKDLPAAFREEIEERVSRLFVTRSIAYQTTVDNNITLSEDPTNDILSSLVGQYQRVFDYGGGRRLGLRLTPQLSSFIKDQVSFFSTGTRLYYEKRGYRTRRTLEYEYQLSLFEGALSSQGHEVTISTFSNVDEGGSLAVEGRVRLFDSVNNSDLDAYQPTISGTYFRSQWAGGRLTLGARAFANVNTRRKGRKFTFLATSPSIQYDRPLMRGVQLNLAYEYAYRDYLYQETGFSKKRKTKSQSVRLGLTIGLERGIQILVNGSWLGHRSNLDSIPPDTEEALVSGTTSAQGSYEKIVGTVGLRLVF
ncbi:MAG: tetratricopeptide repeat protein [Nitrospiria bacterium]